MSKKVRLSSELTFALAIVLIAIGVAMCAASDFGVSMIVGAAYILSLKFSFLSFGLAEYVIQGILFVVMCILLRKIKPLYLQSFATCIVYGAVLDLFRFIIPFLREDASLSMPERVVLFIAGGLISSLAVAMFFKTYLYPQVYEFFVKYVSRHFNWNTIIVKRVFDAACFTLALVLTLVLFRGIKGIGWGTVILTLVNGIIIGFFDKFIDKHFEIKPSFPKLAKHFEN